MNAGLFGLWSHLLAAALYGALTLWQLRNWKRDRRNSALVAAFAAMAVWCIFLALRGPYAPMAQLAESGRNLAFLLLLYGILENAGQQNRNRGIKLVYAAVAGAAGLQIALGAALHGFDSAEPAFAALTATRQMLGLTVAAGALILVHNLYGQAAPESRAGLHLPMIALAAMWGYDLHLYTVGYFNREPAAALFAGRGALLVCLAPLFALGSRRGAAWKIQLSRAATFQSVSILAILIYLLLMMAANRALELIGGEWSEIAQIAILLATTVFAMMVLPSARARAWLQVMTEKHLFEHRYDYREEWLRFTDTIGRGGEISAPLEERIPKALADIASSPAALLLLTDEHGRLGPAGGWNWPGSCEPPEGGDDGGFALFLEQTAHIVEFSAIGGEAIRQGGKCARVPRWIAGLDDAWAGIPLIHAGRLLGLVVLRHPPVRRPMDWEDFDLFRAAGTQAASFLAEARSQQALAEAQRFEDFNRRFAFIIHDLKNLVSQLDLVARNAERHAENPEFRADMILTLQSSVKKMRDLLARLSQDGARAPEPPRPVTVHDIVAAVASAQRRIHPIETFGDAGLIALADPGGLEQTLCHLVQNAIDASPAGEPVRICYTAEGPEIAIEIADSGCGMSAEFVRTRLFQPFASTKEAGFGIGAFEARSLISAMGGRLVVASREGAGTRFTLFLPRAALAAAPDERMRA